MSVNADDLLIARSARNKDMIVASLQQEVDKVVAWSDKARLTKRNIQMRDSLLQLGLCRSGLATQHHH